MLSITQFNSKNKNLYSYCIRSNVIMLSKQTNAINTLFLYITWNWKPFPLYGFMSCIHYLSDLNFFALTHYYTVSKSDNSKCSRCVFISCTAAECVESCHASPLSWTCSRRWMFVHWAELAVDVECLKGCWNYPANKDQSSRELLTLTHLHVTQLYILNKTIKSIILTTYHKLW